ncbi:MAG TPA: GGDEF domain-containing protein, partial [Candidatus Limnocylindria bacterium]|nr:GGDEF domain-containing protein [Candidatus Limnocylindria bacterium]
MSTTRTFTARNRATARAALLFFVPLVALAGVRLVPAVALDASPILAWSASVAAALVAIGAAAAMVLALLAGLRSGSTGSFLNAAGKGVLAGTYAIEAFGGASTASMVPSAASAIGGVLAAILLVGGGALGLRGARVDSQRGRAVSVIVVFVLADLALGVVALGMADGFRRPEETALRFVAAGLLALTAVLVSLHARHALSPALLAAGVLVLALARVGSLDVLLGLVSLGAGMVVFVVHHRGVADAEEPDEIDLPVALDDSQPHERLIFERMARELQGTIGELLQARRTIALQRVELERAETIDELTAVASRRSILERLRFETAEARRYAHPVAVLLLDIDRLGEINRDHGLAIGDAVLREVALRLRLRVREADAIGRAGGDGFLAILPHTDERGAAVFADKLRQRIGHREILTDAGALDVHVSIGVAIVRSGSDLSDEDVLANAVEALSSARAAGGDRIAFDRAHGLARLEERRGAHR